MSETNSVDTSEKLTDGAMCVLESWKYSMEYVKNNTKKAGGRFRGRPGGRRGGRGGRGGGKKKMMMKMLSVAHCQNANSDDQTKYVQQKFNKMKSGKVPEFHIVTIRQPLKIY